MKIKIYTYGIRTLVMLTMLASCFSSNQAYALLAVDDSPAESSTLGLSTCGNNIREGLEQCDGSVSNGTTCQGLGFNAGTLTCGASCQFMGCFNQSSQGAPVPVACGNGILENGEACEDGNTTSGDGCSASCAKELAPVIAPTLTASILTPPAPQPDPEAPKVEAPKPQPAQAAAPVPKPAPAKPKTSAPVKKTVDTSEAIRQQRFDALMNENSAIKDKLAKLEDMVMTDLLGELVNSNPGIIENAIKEQVITMKQDMIKKTLIGANDDSTSDLTASILSNYQLSSQRTINDSFSMNSIISVMLLIYSTIMTFAVIRGRR